MVVLQFDWIPDQIGWPRSNRSQASEGDSPSFTDKRRRGGTVYPDDRQADFDVQRPSFGCHWWQPWATSVFADCFFQSPEEVPQQAVNRRQVWIMETRVRVYQPALDHFQSLTRATGPRPTGFKGMKSNSARTTDSVNSIAEPKIPGGPKLPPLAPTVTP